MAKYNTNTWEGRLAAFVSAATAKAAESGQNPEELMGQKLHGLNIGTVAMSSVDGLAAARRRIGLDRRQPGC